MQQQGLQGARARVRPVSQEGGDGAQGQFTLPAVRTRPRPAGAPPTGPRGTEAQAVPRAGLRRQRRRQTRGQEGDGTREVGARGQAPADRHGGAGEGGARGGDPGW